MDKVMRRILRSYKKQTRRNVIKLPNIWWVFFLVVLTAILLGGSYILFESFPWASNVLISAGCGCFTGLVFYFLCNLRNNKVMAIQKEYDAINNTLQVLQLVIGVGDQHRFFSRFNHEKYDVLVDGYELLSLLSELEDARNKIELSVYDTVQEKGYDPLDFDNMNRYREKINSAENEKMMKEAIIYIHDEMICVFDALKPLLQEREDQLKFMGTNMT